MTDWILELLRKADLVDSTNDKIVLLGLRRISGAVTDIIFAMICSLIMGDFIVGILFEASYSILRIYAGGYHAKSEKVCKCLTYISTFVSIFIVFSVPFQGYLPHCLLVVWVAAILSNAPVENENKPLSQKERKIYLLYCIVISLVEIALYCLLVFLNMQLYARTVWMAVLLVMIGVIAECYKKRKCC